LPERLVEAELIKRNISFEKQTFICGHSVDFYIPERRIVIEVDGNYWHNRPGSQECDERRNNILGFNGFNVYRFWESDIKKSVEECINKLPKD
jgi:very-short-patch-repair endonuclease